MRSSMSVDWAVLAARGCLDRDLAIMGVPLHQTPCGRTLRGSRSVPAILGVQSQTILQCVESIEGILDSLGLAVVTGKAAKSSRDRKTSARRASSMRNGSLLASVSNKTALYNPRQFRRASADSSARITHLRKLHLAQEVN